MDSSPATPPRRRSGRKRTVVDDSDAAADTAVTLVPRRSKNAKKAGYSTTFADPLILKLVARRRFLTTPELGRLLFLTNKTFLNIATEGNDQPEDGTDDSPWKLLCTNHWGEDKANELLGIMGTTAKECFHSLAYPAPPKPTGLEVPPLRYAVEDYALIVDVRTLENKLLFCETITGNSLSSFFRHGEAAVDFGERSIVNHMTFDSTFCSLEEFYEEALPLPAPEWKGTIHLMRHRDRKMILLLDMQTIDESLYPPRTFGLGPTDPSFDMLDNDHSLEESSSCSGIGSGISPVLSRLGCSDERLDGMEGLQFELRLNYRATLCQEQTKIGLVGFEIDVLLWQDGFGESISPHLSEKDLQFAHVLESLPEWRDAPSLR